ncbi:stage V sporulation protein AE [Halanaerobacter jeridensis]|uniref:Stage V sporulation protein AE n=1 Tax=Halanaerobacter jeridensis TaxID=706427 RepID=A0A938XQ81_9FIRM|nr:stage V sporulation protein AE [Halanaerobacter jeridensis]MBM7555273.1 stage V sporulation protein AE [Halanaerobacter jeridensis]
MGNNKVVAVTDGDSTAAKAVQKAAEQLNLTVIYESAGNPTTISGSEIITKIKDCADEPVIVMFDDQGEVGAGLGEKAFLEVLRAPEIEIIGVLAVASDLKKVQGITPDFSITQNQELVKEPVDKIGKAEAVGHKTLEGDTLDMLNMLSDTLIVGIGDIGKMDDKDSVEQGAPITTRAISEILQRSEYEVGN